MPWALFPVFMRKLIPPKAVDALQKIPLTVGLAQYPAVVYLGAQVGV